MGRKPKRFITVVFRCGEQEHGLKLSVRDVRLLDAEYFLGTKIPLRTSFGLDYIAGLQKPRLGEVLATHSRPLLVEELKQLQNALDDQRDLISHSYSFEFFGRPEDAPTTTFQVDGLWGHILASPSGFCDVTLMENAPSGRGRIVQIIDMRLKKQLQTDEHGVLKISRHKEFVGWFDELPKLIAWLKKQDGRKVEVLLSHSDGGA